MELVVLLYAAERNPLLQRLLDHLIKALREADEAFRFLIHFFALILHLILKLKNFDYVQLSLFDALNTIRDCKLYITRPLLKLLSYAKDLFRDPFLMDSECCLEGCEDLLKAGMGSPGFRQVY